MKHRNIHNKMSIHTCVLHAVLVLLLFSTSSLAQRYPFFNLNVENGLIQSQANCLAQDKSGNLWIGTIGGVSRYDGKNITNYTERNGLCSNLISAIACDKENNIWIGSSECLLKFNGRKFTYFNFPLSPPDKKSVTKIFSPDEDTVLCLAGNRIYSIIRDTVKKLDIGGNELEVLSFLPDGNQLWIGTYNMLFKYHDGKLDSFAIEGERMLVHKYISPAINSIYKDKNGQIFLATAIGLFKIEYNKAVYCPLFPDALGNIPINLNSITEDNKGALWLSTNHGVIQYQKGKALYFNKQNGLSDNIFHDALADMEGNVWLASDGQGLFRYSGMQFTGLNEKMGLPSAQIMGISADKSGRIFLGTYDAGLYSFYNGQVQKEALPVSSTPSITALYGTFGGKIWIGTRGFGLWAYDGKFKSYSDPQYNLPAYGITSFYEDTGKRLWIGYTSGAYVHHDNKFKKLPINIRTLDFISIGKDSMLIATDRGLQLYHGDTITKFVTHSAPDSSIPECFTIRGRELWIGTSDNGIIAYNLDTKKSLLINKSKGLQSDFIYSITTDKENNIWAGTGYGIHKIQTRENNKPQITFYGTGQGIAGMESNHKSVLKMPDGSIWFGTTNGALHYLPHSENIKPEPISIVLESVKLFGENINDTSYFDSIDSWYNVPYHLQLPYRKNNITFTFQAITLSAGAQLQYRYLIDGLDAPWSAWSSNNSVTYSALPSGKYTFRAECRVEGNDTKIRKLDYSFEINTPFQKTRWFRLLMLGACILLGIALQYTVNQRKLRRENLLAKLRTEEQAKIRMRTAEDFHDEVGNKITRINVLANVLKSKIGNTEPDIKRIFDQIEENTGQLYSGTQDILWSLTPANDSLYEILHRIRDFGNQLFQDTETEFNFSGTDESWRQYRLPLDVSRNLIMIFKEALNNTLKYSKASKVKLEAAIKKKDVLQLVLSDNGSGFDIQTIKKGHGINNMNVRAGRIQGRLYIDSRINKGTMITLTFKIPSKRG